MHSLGGGGGSHHSRSMRSIAENVAMALGSTASRDPGSSDSDDIEDIEDVDDIRDDYLDHSDSDADTVVQHPVRVRTNGSGAALTTWRDKLDAHVPVLMSVTIGAYIGVGMRVLLTEFAQALSFHQTELLHLLGLSYFLPNALGCFVMGVAVRGKPLFRNQFGVYFTGITTGFCGCCTTFASWDLGAAVLFVHGEWVNALLVLSVQVASAITSFRVGIHCGDGVIQYFTTRMYPFRKPPVDLNQLKLDLERYILGLRAVKANAFGQLVSRRVRATEQALVISKDACSELMSEIAQVEQDYYRVVHRGHAWLLTGGVATGFVWLVTALCSNNYARSRLLALCFGPFGALLRYFLSLRNAEPRCKNFPLYTFVPNVLASILTCGIEVVGSAVAAAHGDGGDYASTTAFKAFVLFGQGAAQVGVLGSLSTVSTWVNELDALSSRRVFWAYRYAIASVMVSQFASACILGVYVAQGNGPLLS